MRSSATCRPPGWIGRLSVVGRLCFHRFDSGAVFRRLPARRSTGGLIARHAVATKWSYRERP